MRTGTTLAATLAIAAAALAAALCLPACGKRVRDANLNQVQEKMSTKEVESILGQPTRVKQLQLELQQRKELPVVQYFYEQDGRTVELHFVEDKLERVFGAFEKKETANGPESRPDNHDTPPAMKTPMVRKEN